MTRNDEKKHCELIRDAADQLAQPKLNYAELYFRRLELARAIYGYLAMIMRPAIEGQP